MVVQVVIRLMGAGEALVLCMFLISLASPNFHSVSESCCNDNTIPVKTSYKTETLLFSNLVFIGNYCMLVS